MRGMWSSSSNPGSSSRRRLVARGAIQGADHAADRGPDDGRADADAPEHPVSDLDLQVRGRLSVPARGERMLGVVENPHADAAEAEVHLRDRGAEGRDRAVADAGE